MTVRESDWRRFYIRDVNGYMLYEVPKTKADWYLWDADMSDRDCIKDEILLQDANGFWLLDWKGYLHIEPLIAFFIDKTIDEKELLAKYGIVIKRSFGPEPDKGPWISARPSFGKL